MKLKMRIDYAIRILLFLASKRTSVIGEVICENLGLVPCYLLKTIVAITSDAGDQRRISAGKVAEENHNFRCDEVDGRHRQD